MCITEYWNAAACCPHALTIVTVGWVGLSSSTTYGIPNNFAYRVGVFKATIISSETLVSLFGLPSTYVVTRLAEIVMLLRVPLATAWFSVK